jgi:hypothetical protein
MPNPGEFPAGSTALFTGQAHSVKILVAEDPFVSSFLRTVLQRQGYEVECLEPEHAAALLQEGRTAPGMVITNKPQAFLEFAGTLPLLYTAASPDLVLAEQFSHFEVLHKPFRNDQLLMAVEELTHCVVP